MSTSKHSVVSNILFALSALPALVDSYDCSQLTEQKNCDPNYKGTLSYPDCLVRQFGVSAFIQCASQESAPEFAATGSDGDPSTIPALEVLTTALSNSNGCDACPLADNILKVDHDTSPSPDFQSFGPRLCTQINPVDQGMCCLKKCLGDTPERSIQAYCAGDVQDLMQADPLPESCTSNRESGDSSSSGGDSGSSGGEDSSGAESSDGLPVATPGTLSGTPQPTTQVATTATTSPAVNDAAATSATSTSPAPQATPNTGAALERQGTLVDLLKRLGIVAVLPILVAVISLELELEHDECEKFVRI